MSGGTLSRRDLLFGRLGAGVRKAMPPKQDAADASGNPADTPKAAVIQGRHCLAYRDLMCSTCYERCPEPGAIVTERGIPQVVSDLCTGCGECHDVCPAPINAILMIGGQRTPRAGGAR